MSDFAAYCFYVNRPDLLLRAVSSFPDLWPELAIVNNSGQFLDTELPGMVAVCQPHVPLTYSQSMNWMLKDSQRKGVDFIIHFHSDAVSSNPSAVAELLAYARRVRDEGRRWACLYTFYDILWAINPAALLDIGGWDHLNLFPTYYGDQHARMMWNLKGWERIDTGIQGMSHKWGEGPGEDGSATLRSDERLSFLNGQTFPLHTHLYDACWGGHPGKERFAVPFDRADLFGKDVAR